MGIRQRIGRLFGQRQTSPPSSEVTFTNLDGLFQLSGRRVANRRNQPGTLRAQLLYDNYSYGGELINNVVDFALGKGLKVDSGSDYVNEKVMGWRWSALNPNANFKAMMRMAIRHLLRDGDIFAQKTIIGDEPKVYFINPLNIGYGNIATSRQGEKVWDGVVVEEQTLIPKAYLYRPYYSLNRLTPRELKRIPAETVIHVFEGDYPDQPRGQSWMFRSLTALEHLQEFTMLLKLSAEQTYRNVGYYAIPVEYMKNIPDNIDQTAMTEDEQIAAAAKQLLFSTKHQDPSKVRFLPKDTEWVSQTYSAPQNAVAIEAYTAHLLTEAARGMGISMAALTGDFGTKGYLSSKFALAADREFYMTVQGYAVIFATAVLDWVSEIFSLMDTRFAREYGGWKVTPRAFASVDPSKDASAMRIRMEQGVTSPQAEVRELGGDWDEIVAERMEAAQIQSEINEVLGISGGPPPAPEPDDEDLASAVADELAEQDD